MNKPKHIKETLNKSSHRRKPVSSLLKILDSGFRRNGNMRLVQRFLKKARKEARP